MKKILVTGGSGFIGSYVVDNLLNKGYEVTIFDREKKGLGMVKTFMGDVTNQEAVLDAVGKSDGVIHLAGRLGTVETINDPIPSVMVNTIGSLNVFKAVKDFEIPAVYISVGNYWMNNSYSITKYSAEKFAFMYNQAHQTKIAVVRGLNAYGPRQKSYPVKKIIPTFILQALKKEPIKVYGDGEQVMDMIYVEDIAEVLVRALTVDHNQYDRVFEAGTGRVTTVNEIATLINNLTGNLAGITHVPMRSGEESNSVVKGNTFTLLPLGKFYFSALEKGLLPTIKYYKDL